jgi:hypothetical protein
LLEFSFVPECLTYSHRGGRDDRNVEGYIFEGGGATQFLQFWADDMPIKGPIMVAVEKQMKQDSERKECVHLTTLLLLLNAAG